MSRTVTAYYDNRAAADAARERLRAAGFDAGHVLDRSSDGYSESEYSTRDKPGIWASIKSVFLPDEDRHHYEEGIRRGGAVVSVDVDGDDVPRVVQILENDAADIGHRAQSWRESGWNYDGGRSPAAAGSAAAATRVDMGGGRSPDYDRNGPEEYGFATRETDTGRTRSYFSKDYATEPGYAHGGRTGSALAD